MCLTAYHEGKRGGGGGSEDVLEGVESACDARIRLKVGLRAPGWSGGDEQVGINRGFARGSVRGVSRGRASRGGGEGGGGCRGC